DVDGKEVECVLTGGEKCSFKFDILTEEIEKRLVDGDLSDANVSHFLASL
ncbi:unnamed protein product, partial [marine sediment metagenome]